jgi:hypothetical protein
MEGLIEMNVTKEFDKVTGNSTVLVYASDYIHACNVKNGVDIVSAVAITKADLTDENKRQAFEMLINAKYRCSARLGKILFNTFEVIASYSKDYLKSLDNNYGLAFEKALEIDFTKSIHGTIQEDKGQKIDLFLKRAWTETRSTKRRVQIKTSVKGASVNI